MRFEGLESKPGIIGVDPIPQALTSLLCTGVICYICHRNLTSWLVVKDLQPPASAAVSAQNTPHDAPTCGTCGKDHLSRFNRNNKWSDILIKASLLSVLVFCVGLFIALSAWGLGWGVSGHVVSYLTTAMCVVIMGGWSTGMYYYRLASLRPALDYYTLRHPETSDSTSPDATYRLVRTTFLACPTTWRWYHRYIFHGITALSLGAITLFVILKGSYYFLPLFNPTLVWAIGSLPMSGVSEVQVRGHFKTGLMYLAINLPTVIIGMFFGKSAANNAAPNNDLQLSLLSRAIPVSWSNVYALIMAIGWFGTVQRFESTRRRYATVPLTSDADHTEGGKMVLVPETRAAFTPVFSTGMAVFLISHLATTYINAAYGPCSEYYASKPLAQNYPTSLIHSLENLALPCAALVQFAMFWVKGDLKRFWAYEEHWAPPLLASDSKEQEWLEDEKSIKI